LIGDAADNGAGGLALAERGDLPKTGEKSQQKHAFSKIRHA
jgi:hypothetical protein